MPKLSRKIAKIFAKNATAAAGGLSQFGSLAAGTPNYSTDPDVIQSLSQFEDGWSAAVLGTKSPALEDRNALDHVLSYQEAYILQHGIPEWLDTETYYKGCYVVDSNDDLRVSVIDNNIGNDPALDTGGQYWGFAGGSGSGKSIGEVFYSQSSSASDNPGALPLFTGETIANADQVYPTFYAWVADHADLQISAADYTTAINTYGECPKYVIDTVNKTIRLPLLKNYIKMANTTDKITQEEAGLPEISGSITGGGNTGIFGASTGAFTLTLGSNTVSGSSTQTTYKTANFAASNSSSVYGKSNTNTPAHTTLYPWVCAYSSAVAASTAQAAEFQQALSGKADVNLGNLTDPGKIVCSELSMPSATYDNLTLGASGTQYTAPADGWFVFVGTTNVNMGAINIANATTGFWAPSSRAQTNGLIATCLPIKQGEQAAIAYDGSPSVSTFRFYYAEGSKSLA